MDVLLQDYVQFQFNRRKNKMSTVQEIPIEIACNNITIMAKFIKYTQEIYLIPNEMNDEIQIIRLNDASVRDGYNPINENKISINHRFLGNLILKFPNNDLRERAMDLLGQVFSDESSDSGASI